MAKQPSLPSNAHRVVRNSDYQSTGVSTGATPEILVLERSGLIDSLGVDLILLAGEFLKDLRNAYKEVCCTFAADLFNNRANANAWKDIPKVNALLAQSKFADIKVLVDHGKDMLKLQGINKAILWHLTGRVAPTESEVTYGADAYVRGDILPSSSSEASLRSMSSPRMPFPMSNSSQR